MVHMLNIYFQSKNNQTQTFLRTAVMNHFPLSSQTPDDNSDMAMFVHMIRRQTHSNTHSTKSETTTHH